VSGLHGRLGQTLEERSRVVLCGVLNNSDQEADAMGLSLAIRCDYWLESLCYTNTAIGLSLVKCSHRGIFSDSMYTVH